VWLVPLLVSIAQGGGAAELAYLNEISRAEWYVVGADADNGHCQTAAPGHVYRFAWADAPVAR